MLDWLATIMVLTVSLVLLTRRIILIFSGKESGCDHCPGQILTESKESCGQKSCRNCDCNCISKTS